MRLIDADALEELFREVIGSLFRKTDCNLNFEYMIRSSAMTIEMIKDASTIDAVEVVRCKDCKYRQEDTIFHKLYCDGREVVADGYCWKGKRKSDE